MSIIQALKDIIGYDPDAKDGEPVKRNINRNGIREIHERHFFATHINIPPLQVCGAPRAVFRFTDQEEFMDSDYLAEPYYRYDSHCRYVKDICTHAVSMSHSVELERVIPIVQIPWVSKMTDKKIYYHLPGLFEFYELYRSLPAGISRTPEILL